MKVVFSRAARADLLEIGDFIAEDNRAAARRYVDALERRSATLRHMPARIAVAFEMDPPIRTLVHGRHRIYFSIRANHVLVERVIDAARLVRPEAFR